VVSINITRRLHTQTGITKVRSIKLTNASIMLQLQIRRYQNGQPTAYVVPMSESEVNSIHQYPTSSSSIPVAYATPLVTQPNVVSRSDSQVLPINESRAPPVVVRGERSVGNRFHNHFQQIAQHPSLSAPSRTSCREAAYSNLTRWKDSLFSCWHQIYPSCVCAFVCPCILLGSITSKIQYIPFIFSFCIFLTLYLSALYLLFTSKGGMGGAFLLWCFLSIFVCTVRKKIRIKNNFHLGNDMEDCSNSLCCMHCVIAQMARHVFQYQSIVECDQYTLPSSAHSTIPPRTARSSSRHNRIPGSRSGRGGHRFHTSSHNTTATATATPSQQQGGTGNSQLPNALVTAIPPPTIAQIAYMEQPAGHSSDCVAVAVSAYQPQSSGTTA
jgi:Cys-rich protein (TIGR01571 family)